MGKSNFGLPFYLIPYNKFLYFKRSWCSYSVTSGMTGIIKETFGGKWPTQEKHGCKHQMGRKRQYVNEKVPEAIFRIDKKKKKFNN